MDATENIHSCILSKSAKMVSIRLVCTESGRGTGTPERGEGLHSTFLYRENKKEFAPPVFVHTNPIPRGDVELAIAVVKVGPAVAAPT